MKIKTDFLVSPTAILYSRSEKVAKFIEKFKGRSGEVTFEITDTPEHYQHKYYRGYLLPDIADQYGEINIAKVHFILKRDFLMIETPSGKLEEIPNKHLLKGIFQITPIVLNEIPYTLPVRYVHGCILVVDNDQLLGYIPSTATITYKEMEKFILNCEQRLVDDLGGHLGQTSGCEEATKARNKINVM